MSSLWRRLVGFFRGGAVEQAPVGASPCWTAGDPYREQGPGVALPYRPPRWGNANGCWLGRPDCDWPHCGLGCPGRNEPFVTSIAQTHTRLAEHPWCSCRLRDPIRPAPTSIPGPGRRQSE